MSERKIFIGCIDGAAFPGPKYWDELGDPLINANVSTVNCAYINKLIVNSIALQMSRKQWTNWQELMIICSRDELSELFDFYRAIPFEVKEDMPEDEIWMVNKVTGEVMNKIVNLAK